MAIQFSEETQKKVDKIIARYPEDKKQSALIPLLHVAQAEFGGWLDTPHLDYVAEVLNILPVEVYEVASFYSMFNLNPVGKFVLEVSIITKAVGTIILDLVMLSQLNQQLDLAQLLKMI